LALRLIKARENSKMEKTRIIFFLPLGPLLGTAK